VTPSLIAASLFQEHKLQGRDPFPQVFALLGFLAQECFRLCSFSILCSNDAAFAGQIVLQAADHAALASYLLLAISLRKISHLWEENFFPNILERSSRDTIEVTKNCNNNLFQISPNWVDKIC